MNFLSHYYIEKDVGNEYFILGLIMPDLFRRFKEKTKFKKVNEKDLSQEALNIFLGLQKHYLSDKIFHNLYSFEYNIKIIKSLLKEIGYEKNVYVFAHVLYELMLDRMIIKNELKVCNDFYKHLDKVDIKILSEYIDVINIGNEQKKKMLQYFIYFREHKYIYNYVNNESLVFALNRILNSIMKKDEQIIFNDGLLNCFKEIENKLSMSYLSIFSEIKQNMANA